MAAIPGSNSLNMNTVKCRSTTWVRGENELYKDKEDRFPPPHVIRELPQLRRLCGKSPGLCNQEPVFTEALPLAFVYKRGLLESEGSEGPRLNH